MKCMCLIMITNFTYPIHPCTDMSGESFVTADQSWRQHVQLTLWHVTPYDVIIIYWYVYTVMKMWNSQPHHFVLFRILQSMYFCFCLVFCCLCTSHFVSHFAVYVLLFLFRILLSMYLRFCFAFCSLCTFISVLSFASCLLFFLFRILQSMYCCFVFCSLCTLSFENFPCKIRVAFPK